MKPSKKTRSNVALTVSKTPCYLSPVICLQRLLNVISIVSGLILTSMRPGQFITGIQILMKKKLCSVGYIGKKILVSDISQWPVFTESSIFLSRADQWILSKKLRGSPCKEAQGPINKWLQENLLCHFHLFNLFRGSSRVCRCTR